MSLRAVAGAIHSRAWIPASITTARRLAPDWYARNTLSERPSVLVPISTTSHSYGAEQPSAAVLRYESIWKMRSGKKLFYDLDCYEQAPTCSTLFEGASVSACSFLYLAFIWSRAVTGCWVKICIWNISSDIPDKCWYFTCICYEQFLNNSIGMLATVWFWTFFLGGFL